MSPKPKKPPDPSQPLSPSSSLVSLHSYPLSLNSPSLNLANYASCESHFPTTQPYTLLCLFGCLSSATIITIGAAAFDGKMEQWGIPFKLKSRFAIPFRSRFRTMLVLGGSIFMSATVVTDQGIQRQGISCLLLSKPATGLLVKGNLNSHNYVSERIQAVIGVKLFPDLI
uniref:Uncharacterized protein n=1 Tax=Opuntia streptacantha TaxID=393608 RepID=A0A7C9EJU5_OPUST